MALMPGQEPVQELPYVFSVEGFYRMYVSSAPIQEPYVFSHGVAGVFSSPSLDVSSSFIPINPDGFQPNPKKHPYVRRQPARKRKRKAAAPTEPAPTFKPASSVLVPLFTFDRRTLLPTGLYSPSIYAIIYTHPYSSPQRKSIIEHYRIVAWRLRCALVGSPLAGLFDCAAETAFETVAEELAASDAAEGRLRRVFRRFFHAARLRRLARRVLNAEDPATLCLPRIPIVLYDWVARGVWRYEAASVRDQISAELSHVSYGFPASQMPRNPLTNKEYTYGQLLSIVRQLRAAGKTNSLVEGYAEVGCKCGVFQALNWRKIRLRHFERVYADERSEEFREDCGGFLVDLVYTLVRMEFRLELEEIFTWAVKYAIDTPYMQEWKGLYRQFQLTEILYKDDPAYDRMRRSINGLAAILFKRKKDLDGLKSLWRNRVVMAAVSADSGADANAGYETESYETESADADDEYNAL